MAKRKTRIANGGAPRKRTWNHKTTSQRMGTVPRDDRTTVLNPERPYDVMRPKWNKPSPLVCRIFPNFNYDDPSTFDPTRLDPEDPHSFSDWVRSVPTARWVGLDQAFTFILYDPREEREGRYSKYDNPFVIMQDAFAQAIKAGNAFVGRRDVMTGRWAAINNNGNFKRATNTFFYQGLIYANGENVYVDRGEPPKGAAENSRTQIIQMSSTGGIELETLASTLLEDYTGDTSDQDAAYLAGDLVDLEKGKFVTFYNPTSSSHVDKLSNVLDEEAYDALLAELEEEMNKDKKGGGGRGWRVVVSDSFKNRRSEFSADLAEYGWDEAAANVQWWDDLLRFPSHDEICLWLATAFRSEPGLLEWGWKDHPQFFTDEVDAILKSRTSQAVDGGRDDDDDEYEDDDVSEDGDDDESLDGAGGRSYKVPSRFSKSSALPKVEDADDEIDEYDVEPEADEEPEAPVKKAKKVDDEAKPKKTISRAALKKRLKKRRAG